MPTTLGAVLRTLMPNGTRGDDCWSIHPYWPPDLFAAAATVAKKTNCYTLLVNSNSDNINIRTKVLSIASSWSQRRKGFELVDPDVQDLWAKIWENEDSDLEALNGAEDHWLIACNTLVSIADETCKGIGFNCDKDNWVQALYRETIAPHFGVKSDNAYTICKHVPSGVACVQPKTRTSMVGCSVRSMTHHLALLPPSSQVKVFWNTTDSYIKSSDKCSPEAFNLLVIPFPYTIPATAFSGKKTRSDWFCFDVEQIWIDGKEDEFCEHIAALVKAARIDSHELHGVALPELALNEVAFEKLQNMFLKTEHSDVQFLVAGVKAWSDTDKQYVNAAKTTFFINYSDGSRKPWPTIQYKHHRWKLDSEQIKSYSLAGILDVSKDWWEHIPLSSRSMEFFIFRSGASFTTLICEDLARIDPCQAIIRAVGPNLVVALLMDGPLLPTRWAGRYAMGLADDPGSSVLALTSFGLVERSNQVFQGQSRAIALWKDALGGQKSIDLPIDSHAILLTLTRHSKCEYTLDGRGDNEAAYIYELSGSLPIANDDTNF